MGQEIEHKYTIHKDKLPMLPNGTSIVQGYLPNESPTKTRIRVIDDKAYITIKGQKILSVCQEFEYEIPQKDGLELIQLCSTTVSKTRYEIEYEGNIWELDIFEGANEGLIIAEIEFKTVGETYLVPDWADKDVTQNPRYFNSNLAENPYEDWNE